MAIQYTELVDVPYICKILRFFLSNSTVKESDLYDRISKNQVRPRLEMLEAEGIIRYEFSDSGHLHKRYTLTEKGYLYALALLIANDIDKDRIDMETDELRTSLEGICSKCSFRNELQ